MVVDARQLPENERIETDLCIVGAGAAGITLALALDRAPFRVCLLESGGFTAERETDDLYQGTVSGSLPLSLVHSRLRYFGGSTNHWAGRCRPLDPIDFEERSWIEHSGWPFDKAHLDPYYERAHSICQLGPYTYDAADWVDEGRPQITAPFSQLKPVVYQHATPLKFSELYGDQLRRSHTILLFHHANVTQIATAADGRLVTHLDVATLTGGRFTVVAATVVLAAGGVENARLLLLSNRIMSNGLGNQHDLVGRYFMEHPHLFVGYLAPAPQRSFAFYTSIEDWLVEDKPTEGAWIMTDDTLRRERLVNGAVYLLLRPSFKSDAAFFQAGPEVVRAVIERLAGERPGLDWRRIGRAIAGGLPGLARSLGARSAHLLRPQYRLALRVNCEGVPHPENRVMLTNERDGLGQPRVHLHYVSQEIDFRSVRRLLQIAQAEFVRHRLGEIVLTWHDEASWPALVRGTDHHMGTTRMHRDARYGVVDENGRVHGLANLYLAGSSVFPTGGYANPTLTIVALALRLADHIRQKLER